MIGRLSGILLEKNPPQLLLDVQGVAYEVDVPMSTFYQLPETGQRITLFTHLVVREDAHLLYGFGSDGERRTFRQLLKVNGIGAKIALAVLSGVSVDEFARLVQAGDITALTRIPGIGKKTAERMVVELRDRAADLAGVGATLNVPGAAGDAQSEAVIALQQLGYKPAEAVRMAREATEAGDDAAAIIRKALNSALR